VRKRGLKGRFQEFLFLGQSSRKNGLEEIGQKVGKERKKKNDFGIREGLTFSWN